MSTPAILPASVDEEEDITRHRTWAYDDDLDSPPTHPSRKGKEKESPYGFHDDSSTIQLTEEPASSRTSSTYPPLNDAQEETRRIQENLKRWEQAELQRRKAARQSMNSGRSSSPSSPADNLSRRSSLLWSVNRTSQHTHKSSGSAPTVKAGSYAALPAATDTLPLTSTRGLDTHEHAITSSNPTSSSPKRKRQPEDDPFNPPVEQHLLSPFADPPQTPGVDQTSALAQPEQLNLDDDGGTNAQYISRQPPPPRPLGLPPPKSPPPPLDDDYDGNSDSPNGRNGAGRTRWWHEWLCGCGEGPDRGGDHQAGKTNPFE